MGRYLHPAQWPDKGGRIVLPHVTPFCLHTIIPDHRLVADLAHGGKRFPE